MKKTRGPWRSGEYLEFIRRQRCWVCNAGPFSEPHHWGPGGGMGMKCGDQYTTPLCRQCHDYWHRKGHFHELDRKQSEAAQLAAQARFMGLWIEQNMEEPEDPPPPSDIF